MAKPKNGKEDSAANVTGAGTQPAKTGAPLATNGKKLELPKAKGVLPNPEHLRLQQKVGTDLTAKVGDVRQNIGTALPGRLDEISDDQVVNAASEGMFNAVTGESSTAALGKVSRSGSLYNKVAPSVHAIDEHTRGIIETLTAAGEEIGQSPEELERLQTVLIDTGINVQDLDKWYLAIETAKSALNTLLEGRDSRYKIVKGIADHFKKSNDPWLRSLLEDESEDNQDAGNFEEDLYRLFGSRVVERKGEASDFQKNLETLRQKMIRKFALASRDEGIDNVEVSGAIITAAADKICAWFRDLRDKCEDMTPESLSGAIGEKLPEDVLQDFVKDPEQFLNNNSLERNIVKKTKLDSKGKEVTTEKCDGLKGIVAIKVRMQNGRLFSRNPKQMTPEDFAQLDRMLVQGSVREVVVYRAESLRLFLKNLPEGHGLRGKATLGKPPAVYPIYLSGKEGPGLRMEVLGPNVPKDVANAWNKDLGTTHPINMGILEDLFKVLGDDYEIVDESATKDATTLNAPATPAIEGPTKS